MTVLAVVCTVAVRSFASAVLICVWLDAVQVTGGQEKFSDEQLRRACGLIFKGYVCFGLVFYRLFQKKNSVFDIANYNTLTV